MSTLFRLPDDAKLAPREQREMDPFVVAVRRTISCWQMLAPGERLLVAVSGGADSVALLAALLHLGHDVVAAHFNHGWRGEESERDESFVRRLCGDLGVVAVVARPTAATTGPARGGLEQKARELRYHFLQKAARENGCARIATGHTRDDQAETVLLRLLRGSGITGLAGIQPVRQDGVVRPLLEVGRSDILAFLDRLGLDHVEDGSNRDPRFTRNRLRAEVMPLLRQFNPRLSERLAGVADSSRAFARRQRTLASDLLRQNVDAEDRLDLASLADRPLDLRRLALRTWLRQTRGHLRRIEAVHIAALAECTHSGARVEVPGGDHIINEHGRLRFVAAGPLQSDESPGGQPIQPGESIAFGSRWRVDASAIDALEAGEETPLPPDLSQLVLDADALRQPLVVRAWRSGDRLRPLGMKGHRKLSDVFIDAKIPRWRRATLPVLEAGGEILWVPGVVRSAHAAVDRSTRRLLRLRAQEVRLSNR